MGAKTVIAKFGGQSALAALIGKGQSTVAYWAKTDTIPAKWQYTLTQLALENGIDLSPGDFVGGIKSHPAAPEPIKINGLVARMPVKPAAPTPQGQLDLNTPVKEVDGIGMGVLADGTPFLLSRGLARVAGVVHSVIQDIATEWHSPDAFPRARKLREIIESHNGTAEFPYIEVVQRSGVIHAYPDTVCLAVLEYYAFDAGPNIREEAKRNYRLLAGKALRDFIYTQVGYDPQNYVPAQWRQFHDRVSLTYNSVPVGYFGIFKEIADMIVTLGQSGLHIDSTFVPDISVGQCWAKHWRDGGLEHEFGARVTYEHNYPDYFPQAKSNPQEPWCYPESALPEFRRWFRDSYIAGGKFEAYVEKKVRDKELPVSFAQLAIAAYRD